MSIIKGIDQSSFWQLTSAQQHRYVDLVENRCSISDIEKTLLHSPVSFDFVKELYRFTEYVKKQVEAREVLILCFNLAKKISVPGHISYFSKQLVKEGWSEDKIYTERERLLVELAMNFPDSKKIEQLKLHDFFKLEEVVLFCTLASAVTCILNIEEIFYYPD